MGWLHMCKMNMGHFTNPNLSVAVVRGRYSGCSARQNFYMFSQYHNPGLDDQIYDCLLTAMAAA